MGFRINSASPEGSGFNRPAGGGKNRRPGKETGSRVKVNEPLMSGLKASIPFLVVLVVSLFIAGIALTDGSSGVVIYGDRGVHIKQGATASGGAVGSGEDVKVGKDAVVSGDVFAVDGLELLQNGLIDGDVTLGGLALLGRDAVITGTLLENFPSIPFVTIPTLDGEPGELDVTVPEGEEETLPEGGYGSIHVKQGATLSLLGGQYDLNTLILEKEALLVIESPVLMTVANHFHFKQDSAVRFADESLTAPSFVIYSSSENTCFLGQGTNFEGFIYLANALLHIKPGARAAGIFLAGDVIVGQEAEVLFVPDCVPEPEICGDGIDQDCDGFDLSCADADQDGDGVTPSEGDCDDGNPGIHPSAAELCNGVDENCSGEADDGVLNCFEGSPVPPDPADTAPEVNPDTGTPLGEATEFLYTGASPIQTGVPDNTIDPVRAGVIRGRVF